MSEATRVTVVTVSYNSAHVLATMLPTVPGGASIVVVDNGGTDDTAEIAKRYDATLIRLANNQGFGRGCNAGAAVATSDFLFFVNPDASIRPGCVETLVAAADAMPAASAFNPKIVSPSGAPQFRRRSILLPRSEWLPRGMPTATTAVPTLLGGALFCRRAAFEAVGGFDPGIFLYHEDDDLAVRLRRDCGPIYLVPEAVVAHEGGHSSGRSAAISRFKGYHMARSRAYTLEKFGKPFARQRTLARSVLELFLPQNLFSARRRAKHLGQLAGAWSALSDGGAFRDA